MTLRDKLLELVAHSTTGNAILEAADACILEAHTKACVRRGKTNKDCGDGWFCLDALAIKEGKQ